MPKETLGCDCDVIHDEVVSIVREKMPTEQDRLPVLTFFKAIGDKTRISILMALDIHEMCVCDLSVLLDMTKSSVSHQLKVLRKVGLIKSRKEGKNVFYSLDDEHVKNIIEQGYEHTKHSNIKKNK